MGLGSEFLSILQDTVKLADGVERANIASAKLQEKVDDMNLRLVRVETRLDTYVEIANSNRLSAK